MVKPDHAVLFYIHDPMCSWCWGFRPTLAKLLAALPADMPIHRLLGGLAPDSGQDMPSDMQRQLQDTWRRIQQRIPGTEFNFAFWKDCKPRRSTYPACRAVIAARILVSTQEEPMILAIQQAYYLRALNPSDDETLVQLAGEIGLDQADFLQLLNSEETKLALADEIEAAHAMGIRSYPSLLLKTSQTSYWPISIDYTNHRAMLEQIALLTD